VRRLVWFLAGAVSLVIAAGGAALVYLKTGANGFSARAQPSAAETLAARIARGIALSAGAKEKPNPVADSDEVLAEGLAHWADHCAACHANDGSGQVTMGRNMYPPAPDMRLDPTQKLTDGELFYIIQNGIRLTGMPAWGGTGDAAHSERDSWKLVRFIRHLPKLTFEEKKQMEKLNPKGPDDKMEEEQEEKFLKGEDTNEPHHH